MKYRHELKYQISDAQVAMLKNRITHLIPADSHAGSDGSYTIRSLYFDDYENRCFRENEDGTDPREKFRIRIYNHSDARIMLECKRKDHGMTLKTCAEGDLLAQCGADTRGCMTVETYDLIERAAGAVCYALFDEFPQLERIAITLRKPSAPLCRRVEYVAVKLIRERPE